MWILPPFISAIASEVRPTSCIRRTFSIIAFSHSHTSHIRRLLTLPLPLTSSIPLSAPRNSCTRFKHVQRLSKDAADATFASANSMTSPTVMRLEVLGWEPWTETISFRIFLNDLDLNSTFIVVSFSMAISADHVMIGLLGSGRGHCRTLSTWWS